MQENAEEEQKDIAPEPEGAQPEDKEEPHIDVEDNAAMLKTAAIQLDMKSDVVPPAQARKSTSFPNRAYGV